MSTKTGEDQRFVRLVEEQGSQVGVLGVAVLELLVAFV